MTTQAAWWKSSAGPPTREEPQHWTTSSSEDDVDEGPTKYHVKFAAPRSSSSGEAARMEHERFMELERQLFVSLAAQTERDQRIVQLTDELALKSSLLQQTEVNAAETTKRAALELREHPLMQPPMAKQGDLALAEGSPLSRTQQISQYEKKLANVGDELEAKESKLEAIRLRLTDAEKGWTKSKAEADALRAQITQGLVSTSADEDRVMSRLTFHEGYGWSRDGVAAEEREKQRMYIVLCCVATRV